MRPRIMMGKALIRAGNFIKSLALVMMKPKDLIELGRRSYLTDTVIDDFNSEELLDQELRRYELVFFEQIPLKSGKILVLGAGGGRESLFFAQQGFEVTAMDFVKEMVDNTVKNAGRLGLKVYGLVQELTALDLPESSYDIIWLSSGMYSSVPTTKKRIQMLKDIKKILKDKGYFSCQFHWDAGARISPFRKVVMKIFAVLFLGNFSYEAGDVLWGYKEFIHKFSNKDSLLKEFENGGFNVKKLVIPKNEIIGGALLQ